MKKRQVALDTAAIVWTKTTTGFAGVIDAYGVYEVVPIPQVSLTSLAFAHAREAFFVNWRGTHRWRLT